MEISVSLGTKFSHVLFHPLSSSFPTATVSNWASATATARVVVKEQTHTEPAQQPPPAAAAAARGKRQSSSYLARKSAILEVQQSSDLTSSLERLGGILKVPDLNAILRHFGDLGRGRDVLQLFEWMQQHGKTSISSYSSYIKFLGKSGNSLKALEIYNSITDESDKVNVFICNSILSCLVRNGKFESSLKLFDKMKQSGLTPDAVTYNTELKYNGAQMDNVMYGILLAICASNNLCAKAQSYFNQMKVEGHSPNVYHYSSLLNAYSSGGDYTKADELIQDMKSSGLVPNKVILTTLLKVYVRGGLFEKSRELLAELDTLGYAENEMPYCLLMDGLSKAGCLDEARVVFNEMQEKCVKSDGYAHSIMISAFCRGGCFEEAKQLAGDFEAKYDKYDVVLLNSMLCAYCRTGDMESVMHVMRKLDELAISPDYNTFHILIKYFCKEKMYILAYRTMVDMHRKGHQPEEELCSSLIFHLGKMRAHSEALSVYNMLRYSKRSMCKALHEKILHILISGKLLKDAYVVVKDNSESISHPAIKKFASAFVRLGNINLVNDVMKAIHATGYRIDQGIFHIAIARYIAEREKKELLLKLLEWMTGQGYVVDSSTRNLILKNSHLLGRQLIADILSKQHMKSKSSKTLKE
ncbi:pentatricopeptide repeat-containing protein [Citrus sinensis]|nr:pentatricopeptide repeat-containing protein [Citrus sinensis]